MRCPSRSRLRRHRLSAVAAALLAVAACGLVPPGAEPAAAGGTPGGESATARLLAGLSRGDTWTRVGRTPLRFPAHHPQGLARVGDRYYLTSVEVTEQPTPCEPACDGHDRTTGAGVGHLVEFDTHGRLLRRATLGAGARYHPGGLDFDGRYLWTAAAEYRPDSAATVYRIDPRTLRAQRMFDVGGVVRDRSTGRLVGLSWGSRTLYVWDTRGRQLHARPNPEQFVDFQDCRSLAGGKAACSGVATLDVGGREVPLGGVSLLDLRTLGAVNTVPMTPLSPTGRSVAHNALWAGADPGGDTLRVEAVPDDDSASLPDVRDCLFGQLSHASLPARVSALVRRALPRRRSGRSRAPSARCRTHRHRDGERTARHRLARVRRRRVDDDRLRRRTPARREPGPRVRDARRFDRVPLHRCRHDRPRTGRRRLEAHRRPWRGRRLLRRALPA